MLRVALVTVGPAAMTEIDIVAASYIVATQAGDGLIGQRVIGSAPELVDHRHMTIAAETGLVVNQLSGVPAVNIVTVSARYVLLEMRVKPDDPALNMRLMTLRTDFLGNRRKLLRRVANILYARIVDVLLSATVTARALDPDGRTPAQGSQLMRSR